MAFLEYFFKKKKAGFTLIELVVIIGIILVLIIAVLANYRRYQGLTELNSEAEKVASDIKLVQTYAMSGKEIKGEVPEIFGFYLEYQGDYPREYLLFVDKNKNGRYDQRSDYTIITNHLNEHVYFANANHGNPLHITFETGTDEVSIMQGTSRSQVFISLALRDKPEQIKLISINTNGLVEVVEPQE